MTKSGIMSALSLEQCGTVVGRRSDESVEVFGRLHQQMKRLHLRRNKNTPVSVFLFLPHQTTVTPSHCARVAAACVLAGLSPTLLRVYM